jgi:pyruvate, water dikinase
MTGEPVLWLDDLHRGTAEAVAGKKIGRLADLARAGMSVPPGFVVTTDAYGAFAASGGLEDTIGRHLRDLGDDAEPERVRRASETLREAVDTVPMPSGLAEAIGDAYEELAFRCRQPDLLVAVRSSATGEDAADASCAGQFDSFLGIHGVDAVVAAVRRCWASLFSPRAMLYRIRSGLPLGDFPMAVGVLQLVDARSSGVGFSIHPVTGKRDRVVVEGSWGWGEAVVQGLVSPDRIEVDKADRRILRHEVADKAVVSAFDPTVGRVVETEMPRRFRQAPALDEEEVLAITDAVVTIEDHYGHAVDVEWVIDRQRRPGQPVTITQARPVTVDSGGEGDGDEACPVWDPAAYAAKYAFGRKEVG